MKENAFDGVRTTNLARVTVTVTPEAIDVQEGSHWWDDAFRAMLIIVIILAAFPFAGYAGISFRDGNVVTGWVMAGLAALVMWPLLAIVVDHVLGFARVIGLLLALPVLVFLPAGRARLRRAWRRYTAEPWYVPLNDIARVRVSSGLWTTVRIVRHRGPRLRLRLYGSRKTEFADVMRRFDPRP